MKILVLDNYDSFTYNLVHIIRKLGLGPSMDIFRNDQISVKDAGSYDKILFSPGPGIPDEAGIMKDVIRRYAAERSMLGVCLGHQAIAEVFNGELFNMPEVRHGQAVEVRVTDTGDYLFGKVPQQFTACLYHSWAVVPGSLGNDLEVTALDQYDTIMGLRHREYDIRGLQFHPESILTEHGIQMIENWIKN
jgi:anthranilate synthase component 2